MKKAGLCLFLFLGISCTKLDPGSTMPVLKQLEGTSWRAGGRSDYVLEIKKDKVKVHLGGVLGLAETAYVVKRQDTNFVLAALYEDTPNPFLIAARIVDGSTIKVCIWEYKTDLGLEEAKVFLDENGRFFKRG